MFLPIQSVARGQLCSKLAAVRNLVTCNIIPSELADSGKLHLRFIRTVDVHTIKAVV